MTRHDDQARTEVTFVGALPPPVTGMTAMTAVIVDALDKQTNVRRFDWSRGKPLAGWRWKIARAWGACKSLFGLLVGGRTSGNTLYYPVSSDGGLYYDVAIAAMARLLGYRLVLHHHTYTYIDRRDWRAAILDRFASAHAVHCEPMRQDYLRQYATKAPFFFVPPTIVAQQLESAAPSPRTGFTLGFLSRLMLDKGLDEVIAVFERLAQEGRDVRLVLAGPYHSPVERKLVDDALARWPDRIEYRGPVYGQAKAQFFADIDAFLFPTRYKAESWGIVLTEALAAGLPVIARSRACVRWIVQGDCGIVVEPQDDYVSAAAELISTWIDSPAAYQLARDAAERRSVELHLDAERQLPEFVHQVINRRVDARRAPAPREQSSPAPGAMSEPSRV